jgi:hypothetical protein
MIEGSTFALRERGGVRWKDLLDEVEGMVVGHEE